MGAPPQNVCICTHTYICIKTYKKQHLYIHTYIYVYLHIYGSRKVSQEAERVAEGFGPGPRLQQSRNLRADFRGFRLVSVSFRALSRA